MSNDICFADFEYMDGDVWTVINSAYNQAIK